MAKYESIVDTVGRTPLVRLQRIASHVKSKIYVKLESLNPGGSIKDRIALSMIEYAEREKLLSPGGTIVEATAGNTGVGLALAAAVKGYKLLVVMPDKMSAEKVNLLRAYGAEVVITATNVSPDSPESYNGVADRLAREIPGAFRPGQFYNPQNPLAHFLSTGPEIWEDTNGEIDVLVAGMGTGGTISGIGKFLKDKNSSITIVGADPEGSILSGDTPKAYKVEGIGEDFIPKTFNRQVVDEMVRVSDMESFSTARRLAREEGILVGGSSGTAVAAAIKYALRLKEAKTIVVICPDTGRNYISKFFSDSWLQENGLWEGSPAVPETIGDVLIGKENSIPLISISPDDTLSKAITLMKDHNISQVPVLNDGVGVGSINESSVMKLVYDGIDAVNQRVGVVMAKPLPSLDETTGTAEAYRLLLGGAPAIMVTRNSRGTGLLSRVDLISFWMKKEVSNAV